MPLSSLDSIMIPIPTAVGLPFISFISATSRTISRRSSSFILFFADISTTIVSPPQSSGTRSCSVRLCFILFGSALGRSILLIASIIGTPASLAWSIASMVWGIIPSSAATTIIAISVTFAPLALIDVKAS